MLTPNSESPYKFVIVGAGPVGTTLALAMSKLWPHQVAVIDQSERSLPPDFRSWVLTAGSVQFLQDLGLWSRLAAQAEPIQSVVVSDRGHFGKMRVTAKQMRVDALGYVIEAGQVKSVLAQALAEAPVVVHQPAKLQNLWIPRGSESVTFTISLPSGEEALRADWLIGADGAASSVRELSGISVEDYDYHQTAFIGRIQLTHSHQYTAYERFTSTGAVALLPFGEKTAAFVWIVSTAQADSLQALSEEEFRVQLQRTFGEFWGMFKSVTLLGSYPLQQSLAEEERKSRILLVGDALHRLHPVAAQGFNLGLKEVRSLWEVLRRSPNPLSSGEWLTDYHEKIDPDRRFIQRMTHRAAILFERDWFPVSVARSLFLMVNHYCPIFRNRWVRRLMA